MLGTDPWTSFLLGKHSISPYLLDRFQKAGVFPPAASGLYNSKLLAPGSHHAAAWAGLAGMTDWPGPQSRLIFCHSLVLQTVLNLKMGLEILSLHRRSSNPLPGLPWSGGCSGKLIDRHADMSSSNKGWRPANSTCTLFNLLKSNLKLSKKNH